MQSWALGCAEDKQEFLSPLLLENCHCWWGNEISKLSRVNGKTLLKNECRTWTLDRIRRQVNSDVLLGCACSIAHEATSPTIDLHLCFFLRSITAFSECHGMR